MKTAEEKAAAKRIDQRIEELGGWRGKMLAQVRALILKTDPEIIEEWKWMGTPVWSRDGIICTGESYKQIVKLTFAKGAALRDPDRLFNSSLDGNTRRAIDIHEGEKLNTAALQALVLEAIALNSSTKKSKPAKKAPATNAPAAKAPAKKAPAKKAPAKKAPAKKAPAKKAAKR